MQTGLDLLDFPTLVFYQVEFSVFTLRQASRRSWRIGQNQPVKVIHLAYEETLQTQALALIAKKSQASLALEGELVEGGLSSMAEDDLMVSLAKSLVEGEPGSITSLSSAFGEDDDYVTALPDSEELPFDPLDVLGLTREAPIPPSPLLATPSSLPIARVSFLDAPITLGKGKKKQVVHAGAGVLFPELMGTA